MTKEKSERRKTTTMMIDANAWLNFWYVGGNVATNTSNS